MPRSSSAASSCSILVPCCSPDRGPAADRRQREMLLRRSEHGAGWLMKASLWAVLIWPGYVRAAMPRPLGWSGEPV